MINFLWKKTSPLLLVCSWKNIDLVNNDPWLQTSTHFLLTQVIPIRCEWTDYGIGLEIEALVPTLAGFCPLCPGSQNLTRFPHCLGRAASEAPLGIMLPLVPGTVSSQNSTDIRPGTRSHSWPQPQKPGPTPGQMSCLRLALRAFTSSPCIICSLLHVCMESLAHPKWFFLIRLGHERLWQTLLTPQVSAPSPQRVFKRSSSSLCRFRVWE